jgi:hypothetical protein
VEQRARRIDGLFVRAYPRETQEMVFDAHDRAFALFKGACQRGKVATPGCGAKSPGLAKNSFREAGIMKTGEFQMLFWGKLLRHRHL